MNIIKYSLLVFCASISPMIVGMDNFHQGTTIWTPSPAEKLILTPPKEHLLPSAGRLLRLEMIVHAIIAANNTNIFEKAEQIMRVLNSDRITKSYSAEDILEIKEMAIKELEQRYGLQKNDAVQAVKRDIFKVKLTKKPNPL